jgi:hypothetical protein
MPGESEVVGAQLNVDATAVPSEVEEFQKQLDPDAARQPPADDGGDDEHDDGAEERSARVDTELDDAPDEAAREKIRERRRLERQNKRSRQREKVETLERRLADEKNQRMQLEQRLRNLESTNVNGQMAQLQNAEQQALTAENELTAAIQRATEAQDGATVAEATRRLVQLQNYKTQITNAKTNLERQAARPQQQHLDPQAVTFAAEFRKKHAWFKGSNATDEHSRILSAIDNTMFNEGWDPSSEAYWKELESRGKKYLPDRFKDVDNAVTEDHNPRNGRRQPVAGSGGGASNGGASRTTFRLSEARVRAMKEAGAWDDPTRKAKMIKDYRAYDEKNGLTS